MSNKTTMTSEELEESLAELLDECYQPFQMGELTFMPSDILKSCDPVAWRIAVNEHEDYLAEEADWREEDPESTLGDMD